MDKVSVLIPMYNSEKFILQCIQSVMNQTYRNIEIIVIDDGSTDQSLEMCKELSLMDSRISILSQENKGVSAARNWGLDVAEGNYIFFLDSDDVIHPLLLEKLMYQAKSNDIEVAFCACARLESFEIEEKMKETSDKEGENIEWELGEKRESEEWFHFKHPLELTCIGGKLICKESIGRLRFDESILTGEDTIFMYYLLCGQRKLIYCPLGWYYYRMHPESITHCDETMIRREYFKKYEIIRDNEYERKNIDFAFNWEKRFFWDMQAKFLLLKNTGDKVGYRNLKKKVLKEMRHPMFKEFSKRTRILFVCYFFFYPFYFRLSKKR